MKKRKERAIPIVNALKNLNEENDQAMLKFKLQMESFQKDLAKLKKDYSEITSYMPE